MRVSVVFTAISLIVAAPVWAQSKPVLSPRTTLLAHVMCVDMLVPALPVPTLRIKGAHSHAVRLALTRGDLAVISRTLDDGLAVGQRYLVRRLPTGAQAVLPKAGGYVPIRTTGLTGFSGAVAQPGKDKPAAAVAVAAPASLRKSRRVWRTGKR